MTMSSGYYFACSPFSLIVNVIGKKVSNRHKKYSYTLSDGVYGSFCRVPKDSAVLKFEVKRENSQIF